MRSIIIAGFVIVLASGLFLNYGGHPWQVFAQTNSTKNATQSSTGGASNASSSSGTSGNSTSQGASQGASSGSSSGSGGGSGNKTTTPPSTVATMKSGPKAAGSASQLQQIEGPNASKIISSNTALGNKPGLQGVASEGNTTSQSKPTNNTGPSSGSAAQNASSGASSAANKTSAGASSAAQNASSGASSAVKNATGGGGGGQAQNNTNPLAKIPVIGQFFGGGGGK